MITYHGNALKSHIEKTLNHDFKERFLMKQLDMYVTHDNNRRICCLYGLRRTGKTTMILQEIEKISDYDHCILIECEDGDTMWELKVAINGGMQKYVFINEITKAKDFINTCSFLANRYASEGMKIVVSGTDSLGFFLAGNDELYDRVQTIHTTYISYKEYDYLLDKNIMEYVEYGGTLTEESTDENAFCNSRNASEYTNTAIISNIIHSLENWNQGINYTNRILADIIDRGELPSFINKVVDMPGRRFLARIINASDLNDDMEDDRAVDVIIHYLKEIDVLYQIPFLNSSEKEFLFTQPGLSYCQLTGLTKALLTSDKFQHYTEDICRVILNDIVFYQIAREIKQADNFHEVRVMKHRDINRNEITALIMDLKNAKSVAMEVEWSDKQAENLGNHFRNLELCSEIERKTGVKIIKKVVIYRGSSSCVDDIIYLNAEEFLKNTESMLIGLMSE